MSDPPGARTRTQTRVEDEVNHLNHRGDRLDWILITRCIVLRVDTLNFQFCKMRNTPVQLLIVTPTTVFFTSFTHSSIYMGVVYNL